MSGERVNFAIPTLINGVSQQPPATRLASQCEEQVNGLGTVIDGLQKRPPTRHLAKISDDTLTFSHVHAINRDLSERYIVIFTATDIKVFDVVNLVPVPVAFPDGRAYLNCPNPRDDFAAVTSADHTFVVNRTLNTAMTTARTPALKNEAIVYIKRGYPEVTYSITVGSVTVSYTTPPATSTASNAAEGPDNALLVNPASWSYSACYNWLTGYNRTVPFDYDIYAWPRPVQGTQNNWPGASAAANPFWEFSGNSSPWNLLAYVDQSDAYHQQQVQANAGYQSMAIGALNLKNLLRNYLVEQAQEMADAGFKLSASESTSMNVNPSTTRIASTLAESLRQGLSGYVIENLDSCIRIYRTNNADFVFSSSDSWGDEASKGIKQDAVKFSDLPARCWDGVRVRIKGENLGRDDDYYVVYNNNAGKKTGTWTECRGWAQLYRIDAATMPHLLVREADGTFTFKRATWDEAQCGDDASADVPSFIGRPIADLCFFRNRLGFIADENVILSRQGEYYNFWPRSAITVVDTDPVDYAVSDNRVNMLRFMVPFGTALLLFADQSQFQLTDGGSNLLTVNTARIDPTTRYECSRLTKPEGVGRNVYFITERSGNTSVQEYFVTAEEVGTDAEEVTAHVSRYIPKNVFKMVGSGGEDMLVLLSSERSNCLYVYKFFWAGEEKVQSAWSRWEFAPADNILSLVAIEANLYLVVQRPDGVFLDRIDLQDKQPDSGLRYQVHLDRRTLVHGTYDAETDTTTWQMPYNPLVSPIMLVLGDAFAGRGGWKLTSAYAASASAVSAPGDWTAGYCVAGIPYEFRYTFSQQFVKESHEIGAPAITAGRLQLRSLRVHYRDSGYFRSEVTSRGRPTRVAEHLWWVGDNRFLIGQPVLNSGSHRFGVMAQAEQVRIELVNGSQYPSTFLGAEWTGTFSTDVRRL